MKQLSQRLTQLRKQVGFSTPNHSAGIPEQDLLGRLRESRLDIRYKEKNQKVTDAQLALKLGGNVLSEGLIYIRSMQDLNHIHGLYNAASLPEIMQIWPESISKNCEDLLFIDTETTGLSGGAGTLVFLLGVAEIKNSQVINHQLLLNGFRGEAAMLAWFNEKLAGKKTLVSYNGKSFDIPLLANRFRLQKMASPLLTLEHIDLLHWIRRMHQKYWPDCRLPSAEQHCLNFYRKNDISGAEAPMIWSLLIRQGETAQIKPLLLHHYWDVMSLVGLLDYVIKRLIPSDQHKINYFSVANFLTKKGKIEEAKALLKANSHKLCDNAAILLAGIYRKQKKYEDALKIWQVLGLNNHECALESLAKYYEHVTKQYETALAFSSRLLIISVDSKHIKRQKRLQSKLTRKEVKS